jgi:AICAR transformylase/IMP cyclohydrolase PurH
MVRYQENESISTQQFKKLVAEVFFPYPDDAQEKTEAGGLGMLLLSGGSCRHSDEFLAMCDDIGIEAIFLPAHFFHPSQRLEVELFVMQESTIQQVSPPS